MRAFALLRRVAVIGITVIPIDRMLVCQAIRHDLDIATSDEQIAKYPIRIIR